VSPILVRPVREQLEHDRIIRLLHGKSRRRYDAGMNPGAEQNAGVSSGDLTVYPDIVLHSPERGRKLEAVIEVETGESVNHLEALAEWAHFARLRAPFHLYVPAGMVDVARRLCQDNQITVSEVWSYHSIGDDVRFTLIHRLKEAAAPASAPRRTVATGGSTAARNATAAAKRPAAKRTAGKTTDVKNARTVRAAKGVAPRRKAAPAKKKAARPQKRR
jgi:hypothetical protein